MAISATPVREWRSRYAMVGLVILLALGIVVAIVAARPVAPGPPRGGNSGGAVRAVLETEPRSTDGDQPARFSALPIPARSGCEWAGVTGDLAGEESPHLPYERLCGPPGGRQP